MDGWVGGPGGPGHTSQAPAPEAAVAPAAPAQSASQSLSRESSSSTVGGAPHPTAQGPGSNTVSVTKQAPADLATTTASEHSAATPDTEAEDGVEALTSGGTQTSKGSLPGREDASGLGGGNAPRQSMVSKIWGMFFGASVGSADGRTLSSRCRPAALLAASCCRACVPADHPKRPATFRSHRCNGSEDRCPHERCHPDSRHIVACFGTGGNESTDWCGCAA